MTSVDRRVTDAMTGVIQEFVRDAADRMTEQGMTEAEVIAALNEHMTGEAFKDWLRRSQDKLRLAFTNEIPGRCRVGAHRAG